MVPDLGSWIEVPDDTRLHTTTCTSTCTSTSYCRALALATQAHVPSTGPICFISSFLCGTWRHQHCLQSSVFSIRVWRCSQFEDFICCCALIRLIHWGIKVTTSILYFVLASRWSGFFITLRHIVISCFVLSGYSPLTQWCQWKGYLFELPID